MNSRNKAREKFDKDHQKKERLLQENAQAQAQYLEIRGCFDTIPRHQNWKPYGEWNHATGLSMFDIRIDDSLQYKALNGPDSEYIN